VVFDSPPTPDSGGIEPVDSGDSASDCETSTWYQDADGDGYGDAASASEACEQPEGYVDNAGDCYDGDALAYPGSHATEVPGDGVDQDCDGLDTCRDLNCDGWPDIVFAQTDLDEDYDYVSRIYLGSADGYSSENYQELPTLGAMGVDAGDLDGDGYLDLVFASVQDGEEREVDSLVYYGSAKGFDEQSRVELPTIGCADPTVADVDQDGWLDLVFANRYRGDGLSVDTYSNDSYVYWGGKEGFSEENRLGLPTIGAARSRVADLNDDGLNDIVFANGVTDIFFITESYVYWGTDKGWSEETRSALPTVFPEGLAVDDMNGDGFLDLLFTTWVCTLYCSQASRIYWGDAAGGVDPESYLQLEDAVGAVDAQVADLDGDGQQDLVLANGGIEWDLSFADASFVYYGSKGSFDLDRRVELPTTAASECGVEDLDGDGFPDVVCASHYAPDSGDEVSQIYWGSKDGFSEHDLTELPTTHAAGMKIVGSIYPAP